MSVNVSVSVCEDCGEKDGALSSVVRLSCFYKFLFVKSLSISLDGFGSGLFVCVCLKLSGFDV